MGGLKETLCELFAGQNPADSIRLAAHFGTFRHWSDDAIRRAY